MYGTQRAVCLPRNQSNTSCTYISSTHVPRNQRSRFRHLPRNQRPETRGGRPISTSAQKDQKSVSLSRHLPGNQPGSISRRNTVLSVWVWSTILQVKCMYCRTWTTPPLSPFGCVVPCRPLLVEGRDSCLVLPTSDTTVQGRLDLLKQANKHTSEGGQPLRRSSRR